MRCCIIRQKHNDEQRREPEAELWQQKRLKWLASPGVFRSKQFQYQLEGYDYGVRTVFIRK